MFNLQNKKDGKKNYQKYLWRPAAVLGALLVWQLVSLLVNSRILLVGPIEVFLRLLTIWRGREFWTSILFSLTHIFGGFAAGFVLGLFFACLAYRFKAFKIILWPWMATVKSVPVASFVVICLIWLSPANLSIFISFLIVLPIVYQNTLTAMEGLDPALTDLANMEKLSYPRRLLYIFFPNITDQLVSTVSLTAGVAWKAGIAAEVIGTPHGSIGRQLYLSKIYLATDDLLAWTVIIVLLSVGFEKLFVFLIKKGFELKAK